MKGGRNTKATRAYYRVSFTIVLEVDEDTEDHDTDSVCDAMAGIIDEEIATHRADRGESRDGLRFLDALDFQSTCTDRGEVP